MMYYTFNAAMTSKIFFIIPSSQFPKPWLSTYVTAENGHGSRPGILQILIHPNIRVLPRLISSINPLHNFNNNNFYRFD
jgi:hypothetical protein